MDKLGLQKFLRQALVSYLQKARNKNPAFSMRALARKSGIASTTISEFIKGNRAVSLKMSQRILTNLGIDLPREFQNIDQKFLDLKPNPSIVNKLLSKWYFLPILCLLEIHKEMDVCLIAKDLGLKNTAINHCIKLLKAAELIKVSANGNVEPTYASFSVEGDGYKAIRESHRQFLTMAIALLKQLDKPDVFATTDFSSIVVSADPTQIPKAKQEIKRFQYKLSQLLGRGKPSVVLTVGTQLFPVTGIEAEL